MIRLAAVSTIGDVHVLLRLAKDNEPRVYEAAIEKLRGPEFCKIAIDEMIEKARRQSLGGERHNYAQAEDTLYAAIALGLDKGAVSSNLKEELYARLGRTRHLKGDRSGAIYALQHAVEELKTRNPEYLCWLADASVEDVDPELARLRYEMALDCYNSAIETDPTFAHA
jgi:tetratricopeptide (TPR) repeat protein